MVATGDDPEKDSPDTKMNDKKERKASPKQIEMLSRFYKGDKLEALLQFNNIEKLEDMPMDKASNLITKITKMGEKKNAGTDQN
jgi:hypothetical protein